MSLKLTQKNFLYGTQELELLDEVIKVKTTSLLKGTKELEIVLAILNPEPVIDKSRLNFHSRVKCGPLISLDIDKPNANEFNTFVQAVKERALKEYGSFSGLSR